MSSSDVESLRPAPRQRGSCMDTFLLVSVVTLFLMVLSGAALGFWLVKGLRAEMDGFHTAPEPIKSAMNMSPTGLPNVGPSYKVSRGHGFRLGNGILFTNYLTCVVHPTPYYLLPIS